MAGALLVPPACADGGEAPPLRLTRDGTIVEFSPSGAVATVRDRSGAIWSEPTAAPIQVGIEAASELIACDHPTRTVAEGDRLSFEYDLSPRAPLRLRYAIRLVDAGAGAVALERTIQVVPAAPPLRSDVRVVVDDELRVPGADVQLFVPHRDGFGEVVRGIADRRFLFLLSGTGIDRDGAAIGDGDTSERLAIPLVSEGDAEGRRLTRIADPSFSTSFASAGTGGLRRLGWTYRGRDVPIVDETRAVYDVLHTGPPDEAMRAMYTTTLADVPPGPAWLHDIAWQHYDYMSHAGRGWFEDIDAITASVPLEDRQRIVLTVHGWFDVYGRYAFDATTRQLVDAWTVFPNAANAGPVFATTTTIPMNKADVHRRIAYAKERGFRVGLYFADGVATGEDVTGLWAPERVLYKGGWQGPDTTSPTWSLNPAHPDVVAYFRDYLDALLREYGAEIDALVWDETFHVRPGMIGAQPTPEYADRAMMALTRDLVRRTTAYRADLALLTSDALGTPYNGSPFDAPPYALMAHGTYQDSGSQPQAWSYGLFPNYRNTLWSCNWAPQTNFDFTRIGVETVGAPVATSNGWGDNLGVARLSPAERDRLLALFAQRKAAGRQELRYRTARP